MPVKDIIMSEFDVKAAGWDANPIHLERSKAIAAKLTEMIPLRDNMTALEFGAGTGLLSLELKEKFSSITLLDNSVEMVRIINEKIKSGRILNMEALAVDLEKEDFPGQYDIIYSQMVFHHVNNIDLIVKKFHRLLKPAGYLAIADLYAEDGSFHDASFNGHHGFDPTELSGILIRNGFTETRLQKCFVIRRQEEDQILREYPVFLLTAMIR